MSMAAALPSGGVAQPSERKCKRMLSDIDEDTACHRPTKKQRKTDDFTDEEEAGAVCGGCFQYPRPMEGLPHHHEAGSREEADRPVGLPCMEAGTASDRLMKKRRKTDESTDEEEADCDESVEKLEKVAELEVLRAGGGRPSRQSRRLGEVWRALQPREAGWGAAPGGDVGRLTVSSWARRAAALHVHICFS